MYRGITKKSEFWNVSLWIYGDKVTIGKTVWIVSQPELNENDDMRERHHSIWGFIEVIPETVSQNTGQKDKKRTDKYFDGQEVYGGDIIKWNDENGGGIGVVTWSQEESAWVCENPNKPDDCGSWLDGIHDIGEVIGNISQSPELLNEESNDS